MPHVFRVPMAKLRARGLRGLGCISVTDLTSKCGGYSGGCNPRDTSCVANAAAINAWAQNQMYAYGFPYTCIPDDLPCPDLSSAQQQQVTADFMNNTPVDLSTGQLVNPNSPQGSGVVPGVNAPTFTIPVAPPKAPAATPPISASAALQQAAASVSPSSSSISDLLSGASDGTSLVSGIPTWGLIVGGGLALLLVGSMMGGRH